MHEKINLIMNNENEVIIIFSVKPFAGAPIWAVVTLNYPKDRISCLLDSDWSFAFDLKDRESSKTHSFLPTFFLFFFFFFSLAAWAALCS